MTTGKPDKFATFFTAGRLTWFLIGLISVHIVAILIMADVPPVGKDALIHHLAIPKLYLKYGLFKDMPLIEYSYYPMNLQLLYLIPMYFGNDILPKYIHFMFALLTAWILFDYLKKRTGIAYGLFGAFFFLSTPIITKLSTSAYVDLGLIFFTTASVMFLIRWMENQFRIKHLILSAIFCGLALGTKYNGLIILAFLPFLVIYGFNKYGPESRQRHLHAISYGIIFTAVALSLFAPWMIKNYIYTNNPIYPLYNNVFKPSIKAQGGVAKRSHFVLRKVYYQEEWWETALIPVRIFFQGEDGNPKYFDGKLNPCLFLLPLALLFFRSNRSSAIDCEIIIWSTFAFFIVFFIFFKVDMRIRWISPIIPAMAILSTFALARMFESLKAYSNRPLTKYLKFSLLAGLTVTVIYNFQYLYQQYQFIDPIGFLKGDVSRNEYIRKYRPEYSTIAYANQHLPEDAKILYLFLGRRRYYCDRDLVIQPKLLYAIIEAAENASMIGSGLKKAHITHLIINYYFFNRWLDRNFDNDRKLTVKTYFENQITLLYKKDGYGLYRI